MSHLYYDDTTKATGDFFTKLFPNNAQVKIASELKLDNQLFPTKAAASRTFVTDKKTKVVSAANDITLESNFELVKDVNVELKWQTNNTAQATVSRKDLVQGLKVSFIGNEECVEGALQGTASVAVEYQCDKLFVKAVGGVPLGGKDRHYPISGSAVVSPVDNVLVGGKVDMKYTSGDSGKLEKEAEFKLAATKGDTRGHFTATLDKKLGFYVHHKVNSDNQAGFKVTAELPKKPEGKEPEAATKVGIDVAVQHKLSEFPGVALAGKLNFAPSTDEKKKSGVRLGLGLTRSIGGNALTFGSDFNVGQYLNGGNETDQPHSFGFELKLR